MTKKPALVFAALLSGCVAIEGVDMFYPEPDWATGKGCARYGIDENLPLSSIEAIETHWRVPISELQRVCSSDYACAMHPDEALSLGYGERAIVLLGTFQGPREEYHEKCYLRFQSGWKNFQHVEDGWNRLMDQV